MIQKVASEGSVQILVVRKCFEVMVIFVDVLGACSIICIFGANLELYFFLCGDLFYFF